MTTLDITVGDREQLREEALQFVQDAEAGEQSDHDEKSVIQLGSYNDLVDRDVYDVHSDFKHL